MPARLAAVLLLVLVGTVAGAPADARSPLLDRLAEGRRAQASLEASMIAGDRDAASLRRDQKGLRRSLRTVGKRLRAIGPERRELRRRMGNTKTRLAWARREVAKEARRAERERAREEATEPRDGRDRPGEGDKDGKGKGGTDGPRKRPKAPPPTKAERALARLVAQRDGLRRRSAAFDRRERGLVRQKRAQLARLSRLRARIRTAEGRAAGAGAALSARIRSTTAIAQRRAVERGRVDTADAGLLWRWPVRPRITQSYGCTGFRLEPPRGSCAHFHDGIDLGPGQGARVLAPADGVVAYVGWSPLGAGDRAFIVVMGHAGGYESLYGHLLPVRKVRVGQWVKRGTTIGLVGNTGRSTGAHLHWEVSRGWRTLDPASLLVPREQPPKPEPEEPVAEDVEEGLGDPPLDPGASGFEGSGALIPSSWRTGSVGDDLACWVDALSPDAVGCEDAEASRTPPQRRVGGP
jgi:murein DD-endopeptidase MepM/ murein hydrolase activator NlpD